MVDRVNTFGRLALLVSAALVGLVACGGPGSPEGTVAVSFHVDMGEGIAPAGVPSGPGGAVGVTTVELRVFTADRELFFDGEGNLIEFDEGPVVLTDGPVTLHLPRDTYQFDATGREGPSGNILATGSLGVDVTEPTTIDLPLVTLIGSVDLTTPASVMPNQIVDVGLVVHPPGRTDLFVPTSDYEVWYDVHTEVFAESKLGVRFGVECRWMTVSVSVTSLADASVFNESLELAPNEVCSQYAGPVGVDLIPPLLTIEDVPAEIESGDALSITGTVSELQTEVASVILFDGPVQVGSASIDTSRQPNVWSVVWTPTVVRAYDLVVVAADTAGNESRESIGLSVIEQASSGFTALTAGFSFSCGVEWDGAAFCWGEGGFGQIGEGSTSDRNLPTGVSGGHDLATISAGSEHACGVAVDGAAYCWGRGLNGRLGNDSTTDSAVPVKVSGTTVFEDVAAGGSHTCAIDVDGAAYCWGDGATGKLGSGNNFSSSSPVAVSDGHTYQSITAGDEHTCALAVDGTVYCWGNGLYGRLGMPSGLGSSVPFRVPGYQFVALAAGTAHTCGISTDGATYCWGFGTSGQLGNGATATGHEPVVVSGGHEFQSIAAGGHNTCGITTNGDTYCWGEGASGKLGNGQTANSNVPVLVSGGLGFDAVTIGFNHVCAIAADATSYCWGQGSAGQLGTGGSAASHVPTQVVDPTP